MCFQTRFLSSSRFLLPFMEIYEKSNIIGIGVRKTFNAQYTGVYYALPIFRLNINFGGVDIEFNDID